MDENQTKSSILMWIEKSDEEIFGATQGISSSDCAEAAAAWSGGRLSELYLVANKKYETSNTGEERAFWTFVIAAAAEQQYDLDIRKKFISRWQKSTAWADSPYSRHIYYYLNANSAIFEGHLKEAESLFRSALRECEEIGFQRGETRCLFHIGIVYRDQALSSKAMGYFHLARQRAIRLKWRRYIDRSDEQLHLIGSGGAYAPHSKTIGILTDLLINKKYIVARKIYLAFERERRREGIGRGSESLYVCLPLLLLGLRHNAFASLVEDKIEDPILRLQYLKLKSLVFVLSENESCEQSILVERSSRSLIEVSPNGGNQDLVVAGVSVSKLDSPEVRRLVELLVKCPEGISKEQIFSEVWSEGYDPVIHDAKIYKLILKTRQVFGSKDVIVNVYGLYKLNANLRGSQSTLQSKKKII